MSNKLKMALLAALAGAVWLLLTTFVAIGIGEWLRTGLHWDGAGAGMTGAIIWLGLLAGVPGVAAGIYFHIEEKEKNRGRGY